MSLPKYLEWEDFPELECDIIEYAYIEQYYQTITIWRDDNYRINCRLKGKVPERIPYNNLHEGDNLRAGEKIILDGVIKVKPRGLQAAYIDIEELFIGNRNVNGLRDITSVGEIARLKFYYKLDEIEETFFVGDEDMNKKVEPQNDSKYIDKIKYTNYWFLNGMEQLNYDVVRSTETKNDTIIEFNGKYKDGFNLNTNHETKRKYFFLNFKGVEIIFGYVDPKETSNHEGTFIRIPSDNMLSKEELKLLNVSLNYVLGIELVHIGYTKYNFNNSPVEKFLINSFRSDIASLCRKPPMPPIPITTEHSFKYRFDYAWILSSSNQINFIIQKFLEFEGEFPLIQMVQLITESRYSMLDIKIQPLATALDLFKTAWFASKRSISKGKNLEDKEFENVISKYLPEILIDLGENESTTAILSKISRANLLNENQKMPTVLKEIELAHGKVEKEALRARNIVVHGSSKMKDYHKLGMLTDAYYSLINRIILKLFVYEGFYIDYSAYGYPFKNVDEPMGGPENNFNI